MRISLNKRIPSPPDWVFNLASVVSLIGLFTLGLYIITAYEWAGVSAILALALFVQYLKLEQAKGQAEYRLRFIWDSELRYDFYPELSRPPESYLLEWRRNRIESDPDLSAREREVDGLEN